jgi:transposase
MCAVNDVSAMLNSGHTPDWTGPTVERVMSNGKRVFALAFRRWLVEQARQPGASVAGLGLRHGINANQLRRWMLDDHKLDQGGAGGVALLAVTVEEQQALPLIAASESASASLSTSVASSAPAAMASPRRAGHIELEVFGARLRLHGDVDAQQLRVVQDALARHP